MYKSFFGFNEHPFNLTPDPRYLYLSGHHREALDHLLYGIRERKGFIAITGGVGTGKTTLCRALLDHLDENTHSALIFSSFVSDIEILQSISREFGIPTPSESMTKNALMDAINDFLLRVFREDGNAVLLVDEAQNLSREVLEQIRMLSNLETEKDKLIQIVLVGQSELNDLLRTHSLRQLDDRITVRYHLKPLDRNDVRGYINHRLVVAGGQGDLRFTDGAFKRIYAYSSGNPRRINAVCDRALLLAYTAEKHTISAKMASSAILDIRGKTDAGATAPGFRHGRIPPTVLCVAILAIVLGFLAWLFRDQIYALKSTPRAAPDSVLPSLPSPAQNLFCTARESLAALFDLAQQASSNKEPGDTETQVSLVTFQMAPEYYKLLKKPFIFQVPSERTRTGDSPRYVLIHHQTDDGAVALDAKGHARPVTRRFILENWNGSVSWVYPYPENNFYLKEGMRSTQVRRLQEILLNLGYLTTPSGFFDQQTVGEVKKFQETFGLKNDGVVGSKTLALLHQMAEPGNELYP